MRFEPAGYVISSQKNWVSGGFESSAAELILDYKAFLASRPHASPPEMAKQKVSNNLQADSPSSPSNQVDVKKLQEEVLQLREELSRIKRQLGQQDKGESP